MESVAVSIKEAARYLGISESGVRNAANRGALRAVKFGKRTLISRASLEGIIPIEDDVRREARLRRRARQHGLSLRKDRSRSINLDHLGGYMVIDRDSNAVVAGETYDLDLYEVEAILTDWTPKEGE